MKRTSSTKAPAISDDAPVLTAADFKRAKYRIAGKSATKAEWKAAVQEKVASNVSASCLMRLAVREEMARYKIR